MPRGWIDGVFGQSQFGAASERGGNGRRLEASLDELQCRQRVEWEGGGEGAELFKGGPRGLPERLGAGL